VSQDVLAAKPRRRPGPTALISAALALIVVAASAALVILHRQDQQADDAARRVLESAVIGVSAVGVASDHRIAVVLSVTTGTSAKLVDAHVTGDGWQAVHDKGVGLVRVVDCRAAPPMPTGAQAVLELHGQRRSVDLLLDSSVFDVLRHTGREACGDVDAARALTLKASGTVLVPGGLQLALVVTNRSAHPVMLEAVSVGRLHLRTSKRLPVRLAPRTTLRTVVVVDARGCGASAGVVGLAIDGQGGPAFLTVASADLPQLAAHIRRARCP
jgi:hypothetical protein